MVPSLLVNDFVSCVYAPIYFGRYLVGDILPSEGIREVFCERPFESINGVYDS